MNPKLWLVGFLGWLVVPFMTSLPAQGIELAELETFFLPGEYPQPIQASNRNWAIVPAYGEEDVDEPTMTYAITRSEDGTSALVLYYRLGQFCQFEVRSVVDGQVTTDSVNQFWVDGQRRQANPGDALVAALRAGKKLVVTQPLSNSQTYSLSGADEALREVAEDFSQMPKVPCNRW